MKLFNFDFLKTVKKEEEMSVLQSEFSFDSAHFLKGHDGKCKNLHGHRWRVVVSIQGEVIKEGPKKGMIIDFTDFKNYLKKIEETLDHKFLVEDGSLQDTTLTALENEGFEIITVPFRTTAENMAKWLYEGISEDFNVVCVKIYETPNNCFMYGRV